jgi:hypothetical protein
MATIKAGTYRFNDVLNTTYSTHADINFTVSGHIAEYDVDVVAYFDRMSNGYIDDENIDMTCRMVSTTPDMGVEAGYVSFYRDYIDADGEHISGWLSEQWGIDLQTITITEDTEVSAEFYNWFTENTARFARLYPSDVVYSNGERCFKKLNKSQ